MKIRILTLAKTAESTFRALEEDYRKRLLRFYPVEFVEIKRSSLKDGMAAWKDWEKVESKKGKSLVVLLDERGKVFTSKELSLELDKWEKMGRDLVFVVGGPEGFPEELKQKADLLLSLSNLTFPHKWVRLILIEALYRAKDILQGGPYHRE
jgi:23S rRNA (pseudouridine1915-N3)-methyltransferase